MFMVFNLIYWPMCLHSGKGGWLSVGGEDTVIMTQTSSPIIDIDRIPDYQYAGLPLGEFCWWKVSTKDFICSGIYTNYYGKGCQRTSRGTFNKNCKKPRPTQQGDQVRPVRQGYWYIINITTSINVWISHKDFLGCDFQSLFLMWLSLTEFTKFKSLNKIEMICSF